MLSVALTSVCVRLTDFIWMNSEAAIGDGTPSITTMPMSDKPTSPFALDYYLLDGGWVVRDIKVYKSDTDCGDFIPSFLRIGCRDQMCYFCMEYENQVMSIGIETLYRTSGCIVFKTSELHTDMSCLVIEKLDSMGLILREEMRRTVSATSQHTLLRVKIYTLDKDYSFDMSSLPTTGRY